MYGYLRANKFTAETLHTTDHTLIGALCDDYPAFTFNPFHCIENETECHSCPGLSCCRVVYGFHELHFVGRPSRESSWIMHCHDYGIRVSFNWTANTRRVIIARSTGPKQYINRNSSINKDADYYYCILCKLKANIGPKAPIIGFECDLLYLYYHPSPTQPYPTPYRRVSG